jgi:outer membrane lipoprotein SlyB
LNGTSIAKEQSEVIRKENLREGKRTMKKFLAAMVLMTMMTFALPLSADAQTRRGRSYRTRTYYSQTYQRPSFYRRHRNVVNMGVATGAGALLGGIIGGKKGAGIGALLGAGGGALYTYKIKPKRRRY